MENSNKGKQEDNKNLNRPKKWKIIMSQEDEKFLKKQSFDVQDLFRKMISSVKEMGGYGKKWLFGPIHEIVSPLCWGYWRNKKTGLPYYISQRGKADEAYLRLVVEENVIDKIFTVRFICSNKREYEEKEKFLTELRSQYHERNPPQTTRPLYNFDESENGMEYRKQRGNLDAIMKTV